MRTLSLSVAVLLAGALAVATADDKAVKLSGENTKVEFTGTKKGGKHDGGFKKLTGTADASKIEVEVDVASLWSDDKKLTGHLLSADFFDAKKHPTIKFISTKIDQGDKGTKITGELTMLGKTKEVTFPAEVTAKDGKMTLNAKFEIDRTEWGMIYGKGMIDNAVKLSISVDAK